MYVTSRIKRHINRLFAPEAASFWGKPFYSALRAANIPKTLRDTKAILVIRLDWVGDMVCTSAFLRELRRNVPKAWITLVVNPRVYNLVELCPYVDEVLTFEPRLKGRFKRQRMHLKLLLFSAKNLWKRHFDIAILPRRAPDYYWAKCLAFYAKTLRRVGYRDPQFASYDGLLTEALEPEQVHEVESCLNLLRYLGGEIVRDDLEVWLHDSDEEFAEETLRKSGVRFSETIVALCPGGRDPTRQWPITHFVELGEWLVKFSQVLIIGGPGEETLGITIQKRLGNKCINLVGQTSIRQAAALLKRVDLYVGNDTGPKHLAAALGVPIVEINALPRSVQGGWAHDRFILPWKTQAIVLQPEHPLPPCTQVCRASHSHCISQVSVEEVKKAVVRLLDRS